MVDSGMEKIQRVGDFWDYFFKRYIDIGLLDRVGE